MAEIHATAIVDPRAELSDSASVGAYSLIGPHVRIGDGTTVGPHCVLEGRTTIGRDNRIFQFCSLGAAPQDKKYAGEPTELHIGDGNTIREFCTFNVGTVQDAGVTRVGNDNWVMAYVHLAHDVQLGSHTVLANYAAFAGHVQIGDYTIVGGLSGVHQFVKVGAFAFIGFGSAVTQDVPPFTLVDGNPMAVRGPHLEGPRRRGFSAERLALIKRMHRILYRSGKTLADAIDEIAALADPAPAGSGAAVEGRDEVLAMTHFLAASTRGIAR